MRFLGALCGASLLGSGAAALIIATEGAPVWAVIGIVLSLGSLIALWWAAFLLPLRLERRADDFAVSIVGADATINALEKIAQVNMVPRRTGRVWNILTRHPSVEERVDRIKSRRDHPHPATT